MRRYTKRPWTREERVLLTQIYYAASQEELLKNFPDRSLNACIKQAKYLRDKGWAFKKRL